LCLSKQFYRTLLSQKPELGSGFESGQGQLFLSGSYFNVLGPSASLSFTGGPSQLISLSNNYIDLGSITLSGNLTSEGNCWTGKPSMKIIGPSRFVQRGNLCDALAPGRRK